MSERNPDAAETLGQPHPHREKLSQSLYELLEGLRASGLDALQVLVIAKNLALYEIETKVTLLQEVPDDIERDANYMARELAKKIEDPEASIKELTDMGVPIDQVRRLIDNLKFIVEARVGADEIVRYYLGSVARKGSDFYESARANTGSFTKTLKGLISYSTPDNFLNED